MHNLDEVLTNDDIVIILGALTSSLLAEYKSDSPGSQSFNRDQRYTVDNIEVYLKRSIDYWEREIEANTTELEEVHNKLYKCDINCGGICSNYSISHFEREKRILNNKADNLESRIQKAQNRIVLRNHQIGLITKLKQRLYSC